MRLDKEQKDFVRRLVTVMRSIEEFKEKGDTPAGLLEGMILQARLLKLEEEANEKWPDSATQDYIASVTVRYHIRFGGQLHAAHLR